MTSLDPTMTIGAQIAEAVLAHKPKLEKTAVRARVVELLELVGIDRAQERMALYPHNFSGGMRQRVVLAIALAGNPRILFADEPTTALDVTIQAQILDLLRDVQRKLGTATVFVTHDLGVVARVADRVAVMYAGKIVETGTAEEIFYDPRHPYTWGAAALAARARAERRRCRASPACRRRSSTRRKATPSPPQRIRPRHRLRGSAADVPRQRHALCRNVAARRTRAEDHAAGGRCAMTKHDILLDVQHLSHVFPLTKQVSVKALDDISFQIRRGRFSALSASPGRASPPSRAARWASCSRAAGIFLQWRRPLRQGRLPPRTKKCCRRHAR